MRWRTIAGVALALSMPAYAAPAIAQSQLGVVLLHGKQSAPEEHTPLADVMAAAGFPVERPEMCWSGRRIYDRPYLECLTEIDAAIERLRGRGVTGFVIAGHSLGANGAFGYAARSPVMGVIALAPGHRPEVLAQRPQIAAALDLARRQIAAGRGRALLPLVDFNGDLLVAVSASPETYLSFFAADSPAVMPTNAARLKAPLLYVVGNGDPLQRGPDEIFGKAPAHPLNRYVTLRAGHFDTSAASAIEVVQWLRILAKP